MSLLNAAGYTNAQYQYGWQQIPYDDSTGNDRDIHHWWQLTLDNTNWPNTVNFVFNLLAYRGYPSAFYGSDSNSFFFQRVWLALTMGTNTYDLDPAFKAVETVQPSSGFSLTNAMGGTGTTLSNLLLTAAGGTDAGNYVTSLNEASIRNTLTDYATNFLNYIQTNNPNASVVQTIGGWGIVPAYDPWDFSTLTWFNVYTNINGYALPVLAWTYEPTNIMSTFQINFAGTNYFCFMPQLQGQRLTLTFSNNGVAQLWLEDSNVVQNATSGHGRTNVVITVTHPIGSWNLSNNTFVYDPTNNYNEIVTNSYQCTNATYAMIYAFEPDWGWLQQRENKLDAYLQEGLTNGTRQVTSETLNIMGLNWMLQTYTVEGILAEQLGILPQHFHRIGRMAEESGQGYYVDVYMDLNAELPSGGLDTPHLQLWTTHFDLWTIFSSALEHGIIEQLQNTNIVGASTVKMLEIANTNGQPVYLASSTNWMTGYNVESHLTPNSYSSSNLTTISNYISQGYYVLLPQNGSNAVSSAANSWAGYGFEARQAGNGQITATMQIGGGYNGGFDSVPGFTPDPVYVALFGNSQFNFLDDTALFTPAPATADPVDTADGTFQVEHTDLSLGQAEPRGITLSRYYNGTRRFISIGGMTGGWVHNYCITANNTAAPQACLGYTTPAQAASILTAIAAAIATYNGGSPDAKNWLTTMLIAKWAIDQIDKSGVSINLGKDTLQFVQQPNGVFTPPPGSTATLTQNNSSYSLLMRHGNQFNFNASGLLTNIVDQYGQSLNLTYNASNWVNTVTDWKNRMLTFTYSGTPSQLTSVSDGTRTVSYNYSTSYNPQGDLVSFTDPEGKATSYTYDTNHEIITTVDAKSQLVVSNVYDGLGHLTAQYTEGNTNKMWQIDWTGPETATIDPAGGETDYYYDSWGRLVDTVNPFGYVTNIYYDGQNHITEVVSPLFETNQYVFDGNNNLVQAIDPLGYTNQFIYNTNNDLIEQIDARGNTSSFGYNAEFSLTGQTNGAGDWINYSYSTSGANAGNLAKKIDPGGTNTYGYDTFGQLNSITYPNSDQETFANSFLGDVTNHIDARGFATAYQYDNRRELTNSIAPTNVVVKIAYDAVGNKASTTDARGYISVNSWSPTRMLQSTTLPATAQGTPVVTNIYDNRDWLSAAVDPLQKTTLYTNNLAGDLISQTDPLSRTTTFGYDIEGRQIATTNAAGEKTLQQWDKRGELLAVTNNAGHTILYAYDAARNQTNLVNRNGNAWQFKFDAANRLTNTISPLGHSTIIAFNHQGLPSFMEDPKNQTTTNSYDGKRRLTNRTDNVGTTLYNYDSDNNLTNVSDSGLTNSWAYDAYDHVSSYRDALGNLIQYKYDANGNLTNLIYPGGRNVYYAYDSNNHLTNVLDWSGRTTSITYDLDGRLTSITRPNGTKRTISYDVAGQTTNILEANSLGFPLALFEFSWNSNSTAQWEFDAPLPHTNAPPMRTMTYDADNRLSSVDGNNVTMDADGNLISGPLTNDTFATYIYDARNRLLSVGGVTNSYDGLNNRIKQTQGTNITEYVIDPNSKLPQILMRIKNGVTNYYIYGPGLLYQMTEAPNGTNTLTYHYDYRGSTVALTDDAGRVTDRMEYSLYATLTYKVGTNDTPFLFNGRYGIQTDGNGLLYMRARYYSPYLCRFINPDPSSFKGGLNFYAYANGDPVSYQDPTGLGAVGDNVDLSWLTGSSTTPIDLSNPFGLDTSEQSPGTGALFGNGLNNTVSAIGQSMGQGLYDATHLTWSQSAYDQIWNTMYSVDTPENPAATPYIEGTLGLTVATEGTLGLGAAAFWAPGTSIFYSGAGAEDVATGMAEAGEGSTIFNTAGGSLMRSMGIQNQSAWNAASWFYANTTGSEAIVVVGEGGGMAGTSTLGSIEFPVLGARGINLIYTGVMNTAGF